MTKEEAIKFMENLETLSLPQQLKAAFKIMKIKEDKDIILFLPQWMEWHRKNRDFVMHFDHELIKILNSENSTDEEINACLIMQKLTS